jgi:crotonobetainyl-CoA:carnitine CoA-transferase CaiB-like acyl-CoA transferase
MLLGLYARRRLGVGQAMSTSMLSTMAHVLSETMVDHDGITPLRLAEADLLGLGPWYRLYRAREGWVFLAAPQADDRAAVARELGVTVPDDEDAAAEVLAAAFAEQPAAAWEQRLTALDVACVEVARKGIEETILLGGTGRELGFVIDGDHPVLEEHPRLGPLVRFSRSTSVIGPAPLCGADTDAVLEGFGYDEARRVELRTAGVIG